MKNITLFIALMLSVYFVSAQPYLPLSAGSSYPLTGDFYVNARINASSSGTSFTNNFALSGTGANTFNIYPFTDGNTYLQHDGIVIFSPVASTTPQLVINPAGNVGIGTASPAANLDVNGVSGTTQANIARFSNSTNGGYTAMAAAGISSVVPSWANGGQILEFVPSGSGSGIVSAYSGPLLFQTNGRTTAMSILPTGNVGIGTTTPADKLDVLGGNASIYNTGSATSLNMGGATTGKTYLNLGTSADAGGYSLLQSVSAVGSSYGNLVLNPSGGNVGIGTSNPDALLAVKGVIHTQEVKVDMTGWIDYVFNPTYKLPRLSAVKTYIDENHHLPDMPSEKEVVENGIRLTEMLKLQQKKIEELTLYLIQEKERNDRFQKQLNEIKVRLSQTDQ